MYIVERRSKFAVRKRVENKTANLVATGTMELLGPDKDSILIITADRGKEFAHHEQVAKALVCDCYFAHPYPSWQRGLTKIVTV